MSLGSDEPLKPGSSAFFINLGVSVGLVVTAGLMAGLTMGVVSLDSTYVEILSRTGTKLQKQQAAALRPFVKRHHLTLVTLLLANASANEMLPIFLDSILDPVMAIVLSVTAVLIFGEILPSAVFTGPNQVRMAAMMTPLLWFIVVLFYPISYPISRLLDVCLGEDHGTRFRRDELKEFIRLHGSAKRAAQRIKARTAGNGGASAPLLEGGPEGTHHYGADEEAREAIGLTVRHPTGADAPARKAAARRGGTAPDRERMREAVSDVGAKAASVVASDDLVGMLVIAKTSSHKRVGPSHNPRSSSADLRVVGSTPSGAGGGGAASPGGPEEHFVESHALLRDEVTMLEGVLELSKKTVADVFTPAEEIFSLSTDDVMDRATMTRVIESGFSRVPVHEKDDPNALRGFLLVKLLIRLDPDDATPVSTLTLMPALSIHPDVSLFDALNAFQTGRAHLAYVTRSDEELADAMAKGAAARSHVTVEGVITIEDVLEEVLKEEIEDEADVLRSTGEIKHFKSRKQRRRGPSAASAGRAAAGAAVRVPDARGQAKARDGARRPG